MVDSFPVRVNKKTHEAVDIISFELVRPDGFPLPKFSPGAHVDVQIPGGFTRQYSLCSDPADLSRYRIAVLRDPNSRGGSGAMHDAVHEGEFIAISAPRNHFPLVSSAKTLLFAGGIGITPILCMAKRLALEGSEFKMHYSTRMQERTAFYHEICNGTFAGDVHFYFDTASGPQGLNLKNELGTPESDKHLYVCGPTGYIDLVVDAARRAGWNSSNIHFEHFKGVTQAPNSDESFKVRIASTGQSITVAKGESIVHALRDNGIIVPTSCEQGVCGTCITRVLGGEIDHRDMYLTDEEKRESTLIIACCSRSKSAVLVLDL